MPCAEYAYAFANSMPALKHLIGIGLTNDRLSIAEKYYTTIILNANDDYPGSGHSDPSAKGNAGEGEY